MYDYGEMILHIANNLENQKQKVNTDLLRQKEDNELVLTNSAYLDFCEEVYGYRVYLFNMLDKQQIEKSILDSHNTKVAAVLMGGL